MQEGVQLSRAAGRGPALATSRQSGKAVTSHRTPSFLRPAPRSPCGLRDAWVGSGSSLDSDPEGVRAGQGRGQRASTEFERFGYGLERSVNAPKRRHGRSAGAGEPGGGRWMEDPEVGRRSRFSVRRFIRDRHGRGDAVQRGWPLNPIDGFVPNNNASESIVGNGRLLSAVRLNNRRLYRWRDGVARLGAGGGRFRRTETPHGDADADHRAGEFGRHAAAGFVGNLLLRA